MPFPLLAIRAALGCTALLVAIRSLQQQYHMSNDDVMFLMGHPHLVYTIKEHHGAAFAESDKQFPKDMDTNDTPKDAFRHCFFSALMCRDLGYARAKRFTDGHEEIGDNKDTKRGRMDLFNNAVGLNLGAKYNTISNEEMSLKCLEAKQQGKLIWIKEK